MVTGTAPPRGIVSEAVERGGQALYAKAMPRGATPWQKHSHAFQGIYLERSGTVLAAALDVEEMARALLPTLTNWHCGDHIDYHAELNDDDEPLCEECWNARVDQATLQATTLRALLLGGAG